MANKCISCNNCGHIGWSKNRGNFLITIVLVIFFFVPAVIYEIWRRSGLGICSNCGSNLVVPSNQCNLKDRQFLLDIGGILLALIAVGGAIIGIFMLYVVASTAIKHYIETGKWAPSKSAETLYQECYSDGLKHYQSINQFPMLSDGKTLTMDKIQLDCKENATGKYVAK